MKTKLPPVGATDSGWHSTAAVYRCAKEFQFEVGREIDKPIHKTPDALGTGLAVHAGRARWFSLGFKTDPKTWESIRSAVKEECERQNLPVSEKAEKRSLELLIQYVAHWSMRPKPKPIYTEGLLGPVNLWEGIIDPKFKRTGRVDDASYYPEGGNELWLGDAKSTSGTAADVLQEYTLHGQPVHYAALWKIAKQGEAKHGPIAGIMLDVIEKKYPRQAGGPMEPAVFSRIPIRITPFQLKWFIDDHFKRVHIANNIKADWNYDAPRNITSCVRTFGKMKVACKFRELCIYGRDAAMPYVFKDSGKSIINWKPEEGKETPPWE